MPAEYRIDLRDATGKLVAQVTDFRRLTYTKRVNDPGLFEFELGGHHRALDVLQHGHQVEIWRRNLALGVPWYCDFYGFFRRPERKNVGGLDLFTASGPGQMWLLKTRWVMFYAETTNRSKFTGARAETIAKTLVDRNAGPNALMSADTPPGNRRRDGVIAGLTIETNQNRGTVRDWACAWQNLLVTLQDLAKVGGGDFDLVKTGPAAWQFRWYPNQLGADRSATVTFALARGNMADPVYIYDRTNEKTAAVVGGQGEQSGRAVVVRTGEDYGVGNDIEEFVDARQYSTTAGLQAEGDRALWLSRARAEFRFKVLQTPACYYGKHYFLGDLVTASYFATAAQKVMRVTVSFAPATNDETVDVEMFNVGSA